ncbi:OTU domain-containing protein 6B [Gilbertella persicaria]|uniref:OTU domain-containing protein 6B n=1 Tax=Gilbertella persicaria TaxID=101096 RepID=UPI002220A073|nr:OTU domain-containing protein 6B [Gilbertella persicaria]KAI8057550.1 OTU domain-containing protein 6B [Gilbertella persicaria]
MDTTEILSLTLEQLEERHKAEKKKLTDKIITLRKSAPKSDKRKKREVASKIADLEYDLNKKHQEELNLLKAKETGLDPNEQESEQDNDGISLDRLNELTLEDKQQKPEEQPQPKAKKVNRARQRIEKRNAEMERLRQEAEKEAENQVDMSVVETEAIQKLLDPMQLRIKQISADGHCLYNAFADQLKMRYEDVVSYKDLRKSAAEYMRQHPDDFTPFLYLEDGDFNRYCHDIENTACWGGQLEILALAKAKQVPVDIVQYGGPVIRICEDEYPNKSPIKLSYHKHLYSLGAHYNSLTDQ